MDPCFSQLLAWVKHNDRGMHTIDLRMTSIGDEGAKVLADALRHNTYVTQIDLRRNGISDGGVIALAGILRTHPTLTKLQLGVNSVGPEGARKLANALKGSKSKLRGLHLVGNCIGNHGAMALAEALRTNHTLQELSLEQNGIGDEGAVAFGAAIKANDNLCKLEIGSNNVGPVGAEALSEGLSTNRSIEVLGLDGNDIRDDGAISISRMLRSNSTLTWLCLGRNNIGTRGARDLANAIYDDRSPDHVFRSNHTIEHIYGLQSVHQELLSFIRWNKGGGPIVARQKKVAHFMSEHPTYPQRARIDRKCLPRLLYKIGKDCSASTMFSCLIEMPEIFSDCNNNEGSVIQPKPLVGKCRWRRISRPPHDKDKIDFGAYLKQTKKSKGERMTRLRKSHRL